MLVRTLRERGHEVEVVDVDSSLTLSTGYPSPIAQPEANRLREAAPAADAVLLLTGLGPLSALVDDAVALDVILGSARPGSTLIETSSLAVFGDAGSVTEDTVPQVPADLNPAAAAELRVLAAQDWLRTVVVRTGLVYSWGGGPVIDAGVALAQRTGTSRYFGEPDDVYPLVFADDLVDLFVLLLESPDATGVVHAATDHISTRRLAEHVAERAGGVPVQPWTEDAIRADLLGEDSVTEGLTTGLFPPRIDVRVTSERAEQLGWRPAGPTLVQALGG